MWDRFPWWMRFYIVLLGGSAVLLLSSVVLVVWHPENSAGPQLFKISSDALKTSLGAVIGALSATLGNYGAQTPSAANKAADAVRKC